MTASWIIPAWPAPANVKAAVTTRSGGVSQGPYASFNLAGHVDDDPARVAANRRLLRQGLDLPAEPVWLEQVHGRDAVDAARCGERRADASFTDQPGTVCAVLTADCLPVLFCDTAGTRVAAAHAGWKGLAAGVLRNTVQAMSGSDSLSLRERVGVREVTMASPSFVSPHPSLLPEGEGTGCTVAAPAQGNGEIIAWLGPAIGPRAFEVGGDVRDVFLSKLCGAEAAFIPHGDGKWLADLYALARLDLAQAGVMRVYGGGLCTFSDAERFYSYRRDPVTGRMASLVWLTPSQD